ncbi:MAG: hypothetical protein CEE38_16970 [Planctomycetes bacterium B3_Pla]|nr:MAG: hypothetical protein CEE38_16970 [Planctomycetes bacterium B3_Pla]
MITAPAIIVRLDAVVLALLPIERWQALRRLDADFMVERWFVLICVAALVILTALLIASSYNRTRKERRITSQLFTSYADKRGLSRRERQILTEVARRAKLKRSESIFTMAAAFGRGAAQMTDEAHMQQGAESSRHLGAELATLREKLGFQKRIPDSAGSATKQAKPSSRQIPVGRKLHIKSSQALELGDIEATVIKSDDTELVATLSSSFESNPGELCCVHYYFGASVWEFDASVISYHGGILILSHSDDVRFINRRRFLRVPVNMPAFIARFPFARILPPGNSPGDEIGGDLTNLPWNTWGPPEFVPAAVTELAGPGLRLETPLEVKVGERVMVIIKINEEQNQDATAQAAPVQNDKATPSRIVEDIGEVRHIKTVQNGFSIAVELTGLSDSNVNELVRATNTASLKAGLKTQDVPASGAGEDNRIAQASEPVTV